ncbi:MAG: fibronectin type III domain-containing protein [Elusimicrobia bacterium]|nr:fibronectin type III domain-containing protein [Elusimicrobiota bacterium]
MECSRRAGKGILKGLGALAAAFVFFAALSPVSAQASLNPKNTDVSSTTANFTWDTGGSPYVIALSTASDFLVVAATGSLTGTTTTYINLISNDIYYFRVKCSTDNNSAYALNQISTVTYAAAPFGPYFISDFFTANSSYSASVNMGWNTNGNPEWTDYMVSYSTDSGLAGAASFSEPWPPVDIGGLKANTTYYFKVKAVNLYGNPTTETGIISTATLALKLSGIDNAVYETSATVSWTPVSGSAQAQTSEGYRLILSSSPIFADTLLFWNTLTNTAASKDLTPLDRNTIYYYRVGALNWNGAPNFDELRNFTTLAAKPQNLTLLSIGADSASLAWTALPLTPSTATAQAYTLEASSTNFNGAGLYLTSATYNMTDNTLTLPGLDANTTYYFRVGSQNQGLTPNYSTSAAAITLALPLSLDHLSESVSPHSITIILDDPFPLSPQGYSCEGYILEGSSRPFGSGAVTHSSASYSNFTDSLMLEGLRANTTYYLRMATLNWAGTPNYVALSPVVTAMPAPLSSVVLTDIWQSSATISFPSVNSDGYIVEASTFEYFNVFLSSFTASAAATSLTVSGLDENTLYRFRTGALYNGATIYTLTTPDIKSTLSLPLTNQQISGVFYSSVAVSWTPLAVGPQKMTAEAYILQTSTSQSFDTVLYSSSTAHITSANLSIENLLPNTSYYFRAATVNWDGERNYVYTPDTSTLANAPVQSPVQATAFTGLTTGQMTVNWTANPNPSDTLYLVRLSSNSDFSPPVFSSGTKNVHASFTGLIPNTTYYPQATALNRLNIPTGPIDFNPMATLAFDPVPGAFSGIGVSSVTLNWGHGSNPVGGTYYVPEISSSSAFAAPVSSYVTLNNSATFYALVSNATYYLRVSALNLTGVGTTPTSLGAALTLPATAYLLAFENAFSGLMIDGFTLHWADNGNSSFTIYNLEVSTAQDFNAWASSKTASVPGFNYTFTDLGIDTTYWARIQTRGQSGITTGFVVAGSTKTISYAQSSVIAAVDTTVTLDASYGVITVLIPAGSLGGTIKLWLKPVTSFMPPVSEAAVLRETGIGLEITHFPPVLLLNPLTIILPYRISDLPAGIDRSRLIIALYDEINNVWVPLPSVSDTAGNKVTARTWHLSTFQLMETIPGAGLSAVKIFPNPYTPSSVSGVMHFTNLPPYCRIKIYTFLGELVKEFSADVNGMADWAGTNTGGRKVASGIYIALLETRNKKSSKTFKVAIER